MAKNEMRRLKPAKKHVALSFWSSVIKECNLTGTLCDGLSKPTADEVVGKQLDSALREAHSSNPATKSCSRLLQLLEYLPPCNRTEFYGLVCGSCESPSMSKTMSAKILVSVLQYSARIRADRLFADYWEELKPAFDKMLSEMWAKAQSKCMARVNWIRAWRQCLALFFDMEIATSVEKSVEEKTAIDDKQLETLVKSSIIGSELWAPEWQLSDRSCYISEIENRLVTLEDENFSDEEMSSFRQICMHQAEALDVEAWRSCDENLQTRATFLSSIVLAPQLNPNDEWNHRLQARVKTLCVSQCLVKRFPWEVALFGASAPLDGCPTTVSVPERLVLDIANAREFVFSKLGDGWNSLAKCRELVKTNLTEIKKADKSFWLDEAFMNGPYDKLIDAKLKDQFLSLLPNEGERHSIAKTTSAARLFVTGPIVSAQCRMLEKELVDAVNLLQEVSECRGPTALEASRMKPWILQVLKKAEHFHHMYAEVIGGEGKKKKGNVFGASAMDARFEKCQSHGADAIDLKEMRCFRWLLSDDQDAKYEKWNTEAVLHSKDKLQNAKAKALKDVEEKRVEDKKRGSQSSTVLVPCPPLKSNKESASSSSHLGANAKAALQNEDEEENKEEEEETGLMSFFGARAL